MFSTWEMAMDFPSEKSFQSAWKITGRDIHCVESDRRPGIQLF